MIKAVIFDMDGTLFDTERVYHVSWLAARDALGLPHDRFDAALKACTGRNFADACVLFDEVLGDLITFERFVEVRRPFYDAEIERRGGLPKKPGLHEIFDYLKGNGYKIALATSTRREKVSEHLGEAGIADVFDVIVSGDMVENGKPDPEVYLKAAAMLGLEPEECMGVEDSFVGVRSIHGAGMFTVMVPDMHEPTPEIAAMLDAKCATLLDIIPLLEKENKR
jgi:HAD superfamily hydrolase (TIGR01509 family)